MSERLVLWDIDGTLLNSGGVGRDLYGAVFVQLFGRSLEEYAPMAGRTDRSIILETLTMAGVSEPRRHVDPFIAGMSAQVPLVRSQVTARGQALPGAAAALAALAAREANLAGALASARPAPALPALTMAASGGAPPTGTLTAGATSAGATFAATMVAGLTPTGLTTTGTKAAGPMTASPATMGTASATVTSATVAPAAAAPAAAAPAAAAPAAAAVSHGAYHGRVHQSVLTGNIRPVAEVKLAALGLREPLDLCIGAYGDDHEVRAELVQVARRRAAAVHGRTPADFAGTSTVVVGDTPLDIEAALAAGARAVGVASGAFSYADLTATGAHAVLPDLTDTAAVLRALLADA